MSVPAFQRSQLMLTEHLRNPVEKSAPGDVEDRRLGIYRELIYNNIEGFIAGAFPVLKEILDTDAYHTLVREFIREYRCQSPYFLEISQEFLRFLQARGLREGDPAFMLELAHYEWVELALDVADEELPADNGAGQSLLDATLYVSPLVWSLCYSFPVHQLSPDFQPTQPLEEPVFLLVYRNRADQVNFMASNAVTVNLIQLLQSEPTTGRQALQQMAVTLGYSEPEALLQPGEELLNTLWSEDILLTLSPPYQPN
ncbi:MAG TPA: putative DNA-binding domain-containing protein [Cellvibrionaceae bacterium]